MNKDDFGLFIKDHNPIGISLNEFDGFTILFDNEESISVNSGIDGLGYTHSAEPKLSTILLFEQLRKEFPHHLEMLIKKYNYPIDLLKEKKV